MRRSHLLRAVLNVVFDLTISKHILDNVLVGHRLVYSLGLVDWFLFHGVQVAGNVDLVLERRTLRTHLGRRLILNLRRLAPSRIARGLPIVETQSWLNVTV